MKSPCPHKLARVIEIAHAAVPTATEVKPLFTPTGTSDYCAEVWTHDRAVVVPVDVERGRVIA